MLLNKIYLFIFSKNLFNRRGLSFIEVLYSIVILAGVITIISEFTSSARKSIQTSRRYIIVSNLMDKKISDLELKYQEEGHDSLSNSDEEKFKDFPDYSWSLQIKKVDFINPAHLIEGVRIENQITDVLEEVAKKMADLATEVQLTIHYKEGAKKIPYTITTYFVNFKATHESNFLTLPNLPL